MTAKRIPYTLSIKGDETIAYAACRQYKLEITSIAKHERFNSCIVTVAATDRLAAIVEWFCSPKLPLDGFGYPAGTLLWYGEHIVPGPLDSAERGDSA
jgi:hypothetical protein